jgi:hypothetical protein
MERETIWTNVDLGKPGPRKCFIVRGGELVEIDPESGKVIRIFDTKTGGSIRIHTTLTPGSRLGVDLLHQRGEP